MLGFLAFGIICTLLIAAGGVFAWRRTEQRPTEETGQRRTRAEARQVQTHFEADDDFAQNFQRPTQNEVLETLQMLDHLSPRWDQGEALLVDRRLKNELAESFPNLRKTGCAYPQTIDEDHAALFEDAKRSPQTLDARVRSHHAKIARTRQEFQAERAQANALRQLTSGVDVQPVALAPGSLPFRVSEEVRPNQTARLVKLIGVPLALLGLAGVGWYLFAVGLLPWSQPTASFNPVPGNLLSPTPLPGKVPVASASAAPIESPSPQAPATQIADNDATPPPAVASPAEGPSEAGQASAEPSPPVAVVATPSPQAADALLATQIAQSQLRAVDKYPDLAVPNSEMNIRFVFRYKALLAEKSPRLQDPGWPEKLADECARAAGGGAQGKKITRTAPKGR